MSYYTIFDVQILDEGIDHAPDDDAIVAAGQR
jgi:hypothetical protein